MQFARIHGIALLILASLLLLAQAWILLAGQAVSSSEDSPQPVRQRPFTEYIPGLSGIVCLGFGGYILIVNRNRPNDLPSHPIK